MGKYVPSVIRMIRRTRELLDSPEKWTQRDSAVNKDGLRVQPMSIDAVRYCLLGALHRIERYHSFSGRTGEDTRRLLVELVDERYSGTDTYPGLAKWNDAEDRTFEEVQQLLKDAETLYEQYPARDRRSVWCDAREAGAAD